MDFSQFPGSSRTSLCIYEYDFSILLNGTFNVVFAFLNCIIKKGTGLCYSGFLITYFNSFKKKRGASEKGLFSHFQDPMS